MSTKDNDINTVIPTLKTKKVQGVSVEITQIKVGRVPALLEVVLPIYAMLTQGGKPGSPAINLQAMFMEYSSDCLRVLAVLANQEKVWVDNLEIDEAIELFAELVEVNLDFFVQKVLPLLSGAMVKLSQKVKQSPTTGQTLSTASSPVDIATKTS